MKKFLTHFWGLRKVLSVGPCIPPKAASPNSRNRDIGHSHCLPQTPFPMRPCTHIMQSTGVPYRGGFVSLMALHFANAAQGENMCQCLQYGHLLLETAVPSGRSYNCSMVTLKPFHFKNV